MPDTATATLGGFLRGYYAQRVTLNRRLPASMPAQARGHLNACARNLKRLAAQTSCMETDALADAVRALADGEPDAAAEAARSAQVLRIERAMRRAGQ